MIAWATMGDANASIPTPQPQLPRPMFGAAPGVAPGLSVAFVAQAALDDGLRRPAERRTATGRRRATPGRSARPTWSRNDATPDIQIEPDTFAVRIDGELVVEEPAEVLPMAQRYFLF